MTTPAAEYGYSTIGNLTTAATFNSISTLSVKTLIHNAAGERCALGELLLQANRISRSELDVCLKVQQHTGEKLGYILKRQGYLSAEELNAMLAFQLQQASSQNKTGPLQLGKLLLANNEITPEQLQKALNIQKRQNKKLGHILVDEGFIKQAAIERNLDIQNKLLSLALGSLLALASLLTVNDAVADSMKVAYIQPTSISQGNTTITTNSQMNLLYERAISYLNDSVNHAQQQRGEELLAFLANQGLEKAQFTLGMIYLDSIYTEEQGLFWLQKCAQAGNEDAKFAVQNFQESDFGIGC